MTDENPEGGKPKRVGYNVVLFALIFAAAGALAYLYPFTGLPEHEGVASHLGSLIGAIIFPALIGMGVGYLVGQRS